MNDPLAQFLASVPARGWKVVRRDTPDDFDLTPFAGRFGELPESFRQLVRELESIRRKDLKTWFLLYFFWPDNLKTNNCSNIFMKKPFAIIIAVYMAGRLSIPLMWALMRAVMPHDYKSMVMSSGRSYLAEALFMIMLCACAGLAVAVGCYFRYYPMMVRWTIVLLPMLLAAFLVTMLKMVQFQYFGSFGKKFFFYKDDFLLHYASLHLIPAVGFMAGLVAVMVAFLIRKKRKSISLLNS